MAPNLSPCGIMGSNMSALEGRAASDTTERTPGRIRVIGVGNILLKDEGVGIHLVRELEKLELPAGVEVIDGGVAGLQLLDYLDGARKVIFVDAAALGGQPGDIARFTPGEVASANAPGLSLHQTGIAEVLSLATALGKCPPVVIFGIQPKEIDWGLEMSPEVRASLGRLVEMVLQELATSPP